MQLLTPDIRLSRVEDITPELLKSRGISALLLDLDNTLVSRETHKPDEPVVRWVREMLCSGVACCLLSNNWHSVVFEHAEKLGLPIVYKAMKPLPVAYVKALVKIGAKREHAAVVGDQLFTDILGARLCVLQSILVEPLSTTDLWYTQLFRKLESRLLR